MAYNVAVAVCGRSIKLNKKIGFGRSTVRICFKGDKV